MEKKRFVVAMVSVAMVACGGGSSGGGGGGSSDGTGGGERVATVHDGLHAGSHGSCVREAQGICNEVLRVMTDEGRTQARTDCEAQGGRWSDGVCPEANGIAWCGDSTNAWFYGPTANLETAHAACPSYAHFYDLSSAESHDATAPPLHERADGSCRSATPARCQEYLVDPSQLTSTGEACTSGGGTWAATPCATDGAVGHCGLSWFYGTVEEAQGLCAHGADPFVPTAR